MQTSDDRGWVKPLGTESDGNQMDPISAESSPRNSLLLSGLILSTLIVVAVVGVFAWRGLRGDPFGSARSIPAGMDYVVSFDALALSDSDRLQRFVDAFTAPAFAAGLIEERPGDLLETIDSGFVDETGFSLIDDIAPWIGRSVSIAGTIPELLDPYATAEELEISLLLSADVRDGAAAEAFLRKLVATLEDEGITARATAIGDHAGYRMGDPGDDFTGALVLTDGALLIGLYDDVVAGISARENERSMLDDPEYREAMTHLPADQMMSFFVSGRALDSLATLGTGGLYGIESPAEPLDSPSFGGSLGLVDEGVLVTYVSVGEEVLPDSVGPDRKVLAALPSGTLGFVSIAGDTGVTEPLDSELFDSLGMPTESFEDEFGFDLIAVLESLSGEFTFAITESRQGAIAQTSDIPVGVLAAIGLNDVAPLTDAVDSVVQLLREGGLEVVSNGRVSTVVDGSDEVVSYSLADNLFVIGAGSGLVADVANGDGGSVVESDLYRELDKVVAGDGLVLFADIPGIVSMVPQTSNEAAVLAPLRGIGVGMYTDGNAGVVETLLLVDY